MLGNINAEGVPPFGELGIVAENLRDERFSLCGVILRRLGDFPKRDEVVCRKHLFLHQKEAFLERLHGDKQFDDFVGDASERFRHGECWVFRTEVEERVQIAQDAVLDITALLGEQEFAQVLVNEVVRIHADEEPVQVFIKRVEAVDGRARLECLLPEGFVSAEFAKVRVFDEFFSILL